MVPGIQVPCQVPTRCDPVVQVGADLCMGSLIKNPGGTIAPSGGYVAGRADLVAAVQARLTAPGVGLDAGAVSGEALRLMTQGKEGPVGPAQVARDWHVPSNQQTVKR